MYCRKQEQYPTDISQSRNTTKDIEKAGFILVLGETIIGYCAILINDEPKAIEG
jgi:hypothetical protein